MRINKKVIVFFIMSLALSIIATNSYLNTGTVGTKWGEFKGQSALSAITGYWLLTIFSGFLSFKPKNR
jgi:hypothetical protein